MMLQMNGTGPLLVVVLIGIVGLLVALLGFAAFTRRMKPRTAGAFIAAVVLATTAYLSAYARHGGDFPQLIRFNRTTRSIPIRPLPRRGAVDAAPR